MLPFPPLMLNNLAEETLPYIHGNLYTRKIIKPYIMHLSLFGIVRLEILVLNKMFKLFEICRVLHSNMKCKVKHVTRLLRTVTGCKRYVYLGFVLLLHLIAQIFFLMQESL